MKRSDSCATRDILIWLGLLVASGGGGALLWGSWWALPFLLVYGVLYASAADSRWHECGHGTAFRTRWKNDAVYEFASFLMMRNPVVWHWGHARHHTDTIIVGRDPEIAGMRPPQLIVHLPEPPGNWWRCHRAWLHSPEMQPGSFRRTRPT